MWLLRTNQCGLPHSMSKKPGPVARHQKKNQRVVWDVAAQRQFPALRMGAFAWTLRTWFKEGRQSDAEDAAAKFGGEVFLHDDGPLTIAKSPTVGELKDVLGYPRWVRYPADMTLRQLISNLRDCPSPSSLMVLFRCFDAAVQVALSEPSPVNPDNCAVLKSYVDQSSTQCMAAPQPSIS